MSGKLYNYSSITIGVSINCSKKRKLIELFKNIFFPNRLGICKQERSESTE